MASIDTHLVRQQLKAIAASSKAVKKILYNALEALEEDPSQFPPLDEYPEALLGKYPQATLRKVKIERDPHSFRRIVIHWILPDEDEENRSTWISSMHFRASAVTRSTGSGSLNSWMSQFDHYLPLIVFYSERQHES